MLKRLALLITVFFLFSCSKTGNLNKNLEELDKIYGKCDNPMRSAEYNNTNKNSRVYKTCKAKEMAGGKTLFELGDSFKETFGNNNGSNNIVYQNNVNPYLWRSALKTTENYPLKIADNTGGYIETDWIYDNSNSNNRCIIKIQITSNELISTGVSSIFVCQNKLKDNWVNDGINYIDQEKQLTIKILNQASLLSNSQS